jgi:hypothetical protein
MSFDWCVGLGVISVGLVLCVFRGIGLVLCVCGARVGH